MILSPRTKKLVGIVTAWPILYIAFFMVFMFMSVFADLFGGRDFMFDAFDYIFAVHFLTMLMIFGLIAFYIVYIFKTDRVAADKKALWAVVIFMGNAIAMPIFYYLYIWKEPKLGAKEEELSNKSIEATPDGAESNPLCQDR